MNGERIHELRVTEGDAFGQALFGETLNPYGTANPDHLRYQEENRRLGRLPGQLRLRIRYALLASPWLDYLFCAPDELETIIAPTRWELTDVRTFVPGGDGGGGRPPGSGPQC